MDRTGPLDPKTIFLDYFRTILSGGKADHSYLGRGGMQSISSQRGMVGRLFLLRVGRSTNCKYAGKGGRLMN